MQNELIKDIKQEAIKAAVNNNWPLAIQHNLAIISENPDDVAALNRLGIAYSMSQKNTDAMKTFQQAIKLDPRNQIAKNNIDRLKINKTSGLMNHSLQSTVSFIEEPGKSKVIPLVNQGEPKVFSTLTIGENAELVASKYKIKVISNSKQFIGYLPDNIAHRLIELLKAGYKYKTTIKSVNPKLPCVFIQEIHNSKKLKGAPSFPLDDTNHLPSLSAGDSSEIPPLEIFDPLVGEDS